nr:MAG TPA_asm: hypothetical protein [Caudoviricetes sp.]
MLIQSPPFVKILQYYTTSYKVCIVKYQKSRLFLQKNSMILHFPEKLHKFVL